MKLLFAYTPSTLSKANLIRQPNYCTVHYSPQIIFKSCSTVQAPVCVVSSDVQLTTGPGQTGTV